MFAPTRNPVNSQSTVFLFRLSFLTFILGYCIFKVRVVMLLKLAIAVKEGVNIVVY